MLCLYDKKIELIFVGFKTTFSWGLTKIIKLSAKIQLDNW